ncbi:MAG: phasin family protein [Flammeovirgaceae bacterium]
MEDLFKKFLYTGVGLVSVTADKFQKAIDKLVDENKISSEEGKKVVDDLIQDTESKKEEFEGQLKKIVEDIINRFKIASYTDVEDLQKRVEALEAQVGTTETAAPKRKAAPKKKEAVA